MSLSSLLRCVLEQLYNPKFVLLIADNSKKWKKRKRDDEDYVYAEEDVVDGGDGGKLFGGNTNNMHMKMHQSIYLCYSCHIYT